VAEQISSRELIGFPIHLVGADGTVRKSFGIDTPQYRPDLQLVVNRMVARATQGGVWTISPGRYVIERWDPVEGQRLAQITVKPTWFRETKQFRTNELTPPNAVIEGIWEQDGVLWTVLRDADSKWRPPVAANTERPHDLAEYDRTYDWVLEAISPENGQVLASRRFDRLLSVYRPSGLIATSADRAAVNLWNVRLDRKEAGMRRAGVPGNSDSARADRVRAVGGARTRRREAWDAQREVSIMGQVESRACGNPGGELQGAGRRPSAIDGVAPGRTLRGARQAILFKWFEGGAANPAPPPSLMSLQAGGLW
jgi:hypothetical protein